MFSDGEPLPHQFRVELAHPRLERCGHYCLHLAQFLYEAERSLRTALAVELLPVTVAEVLERACGSQAAGWRVVASGIVGAFKGIWRK